MSGHSKEGREPVEARRRKAVRGNGPKATRPRTSSAARLHKQLALLARERDEALATQTATADILRVISQSPNDERPVFDSIVLTAARLLRCDLVLVLLCDGATYSHAAVASPEGPVRRRRANGFSDRSQRQFSLTCDRRQKNAAPPGLVADRPARTRTENQ